MHRTLTWIEEGVLAVGQMLLNQQDLHRLYTQGIRAVINLREEDYRDKFETPGMSLYHLPIPDYGLPTNEQIQTFLEIVLQHFMVNDPIYVHCTAGCGRTGTMVALWLCSIKMQDTPRKVLQYLREIRPCSVETEEQEALVLEMGEQLIDTPDSSKYSI